MSVPAGANDLTPLGGTMYFQLTMANPVTSLDWVIRGKNKTLYRLDILKYAVTEQIRLMFV